MTAPVRWRFEAANAPARLREAADELDAVLATHGVSERARFAARLVAEELVLNALEHGGATFVVLGVDPGGDPHCFVFEDDGAPFDPTPPSTRRASDGPGDVNLRGRGLALVRGFTRRIEHRRTGGGNRLTALLVE